MFALNAASRAVLAAGAFAAFGAAFVTTPLVARGDADAAVADPAPSVVPLRPRIALADVLPRRDPFAGGETRAARSGASPPAPGVMPPSAALPQIPAALRALPPNAGAGDNPFALPTVTSTSATVTAVITGPRPFALVDENGRTRVLTVGDRVGDDEIVAIDAAGVRFTHGAHLLVRTIPGGR